MRYGKISAEGSLDVTGSLSVVTGLSGSLTKLTDGTSYLVAGNNVTITSQSNGSVLIAASGGGGGGGDSFFSSTTNDSIFTTGSVAFRGGDSAIDSPYDVGSDVFFYVSGSISGSGANDKKSLFGGDVRISGSVSQGFDTLASGSYSHAEGAGSTASGDYSHAEGAGTTASGGSSHAEGSGTTASGGSSHAEGNFTTASGDYSHAEGDGTTAPGPASHAEGGGTVAYGIGSHAEGSTAKAGCLGYYSTDAGATTPGLIVLDSAYGDVSGQFSPGDYILLEDWFYSNTYVFASFEIASVTFNSPSTEITLVDNTVSTASGAAIGKRGVAAPSGADNKMGYYSHAEGNTTLAQAITSHAEGEGTVSSGKASHAEGYQTGASGLASHAEGAGTTASGVGAHAEGLGTIASGSYQHVGGKYNLRNNDFSLFVIGDGTSDDNADRSDIVRVNSGSVGGQGRVEVTGSFVSTLGLSGSLTQLADGTSYLIAGTNVTITSASNGPVTIDVTIPAVDDFFDSTTAGSIFTTGSAAFRGNEAAVDSPSDKGTDVFFYVSGSIAGSGVNNKKTLFGGDVRASGSFAQGLNVIASGTYAHAEGSGNTASGLASHAEGVNNTATGNYSHAEGTTNVVSGLAAHAEGQFTLASGGSSHSEGLLTTGSGNFSHVEGNRTIASGESAHAEGYATLASNYQAHAEGYQTSATGENSHAEGYATLASGFGAHAEGLSTIANGNYSHANGEATLASGITSHAEGWLTTGSGNFSHSEGYKTIASGNGSHAEGESTTASGYASHAEGYQTAASLDYAHAEGYQTIASNYNSHAEGWLTLASGDTSHAEGYLTTASIDWAHAEGKNSHALGVGSHAEGFFTIASGSYQHVGGNYNKRGNDFSLFVIGDGTGDADANRSDIVRVNPGANPGFGQFQVTGSITVSGSYLLNVVSGTSNPTYNVGSWEHVVVFTNNNVTGVLPPTSAVGTQIIFKDGTGLASVSGSQMLSSSAGKIDGSATYTMPSINYTSVAVIKIKASPEEWIIV